MLSLGQACWAKGATYYADCADAGTVHSGSPQAPFNSLTQVNAVQLLPGDSLLFKRGRRCNGSLQPRGSGVAGAAIRIGAYGEGALPRIVAGASDEAVLRLVNQEYIEVELLDLSGGTTYGVDIESNGSALHHLLLRDLQVHDVRGKLLHKESGLVVIRSKGNGGSFSDVVLDGVHAYDSTQWSGIFVADASDVQIRHCVVHDVQGDGIVIFSAQNAVIADSMAWHTGMQHAQTIGTPNAIWTWHCTDCMVEGNEAFLSDSPGVDGGSFDIDFGNVRNTVVRNFGHDTAGYCVAVFAAFGPTTQSVVAENVCLNNGLSPRLSQRQGAILLMTWQGGTLAGVEIRGNRIDWYPSGDSPVLQTGDGLQAEGVRVQGNQFWSTGTAFVDPHLSYTGEGNHYFVASPDDVAEATRRLAARPEKDAHVAAGSLRGGPLKQTTHGFGEWKLVAALESPGMPGDDERSLLIELESAALQFGHTGLRVEVECGARVRDLAKDWSLAEAGVALRQSAAGGSMNNSLQLIAPGGAVARTWNGSPGAAELGLELREKLGPPHFGFLRFEDVRATD